MQTPATAIVCDRLLFIAGGLTFILILDLPPAYYCYHDDY